MIVVDAIDRGARRGNAIPMLLDLDRRTVLLHELLFDQGRGASAPHPFYVAEADERADLILFLRGLPIDR